MKPYTLVFVFDNDVVTLQFIAHCQACAFKASIDYLRKQEVSRSNRGLCTAIFEGQLNNLWPKLETEMDEIAGNLDMPQSHMEIN